jgi:hypothetical protein
MWHVSEYVRWVEADAILGCPKACTRQILEECDPKREPGCFNISATRQGIDPFIYTRIQPPTVSLSNLPGGSGLVINDDMLGCTEEKPGGTKFIMSGSTITT